jgi:hypothetical protein
MSAEDKYHANKRNNEKKAKETVEEAKTQRETTTRQFLESDPRGSDILKYSPQSRAAGLTVSQLAFQVAKEKNVQDQVQALIAEDIKKNPTAGAPAGKETGFKAPEGFSNVIGVGSNPVMEAMAEQTEIQKQQLAELQKLNAKDTGAPKDFTKDSK